MPRRRLEQSYSCSIWTYQGHFFNDRIKRRYKTLIDSVQDGKDRFWIPIPQVKIVTICNFREDRVLLQLYRPLKQLMTWSLWYWKWPETKMLWSRHYCGFSERLRTISWHPFFTDTTFFFCQTAEVKWLVVHSWDFFQILNRHERVTQAWGLVLKPNNINLAVYVDQILCATTAVK